MSSVLSAIPSVLTLPTKFSALITPSYTDSTVNQGSEFTEMPIPFTVVNQVLDINVTQSADFQLFVNDGEYPVSRANIQGKIFGGMKIITSLGANMTSYLRNLIKRQEGLGAAYTGPLVLYIKPIMTKVQLVSPAFAVDEGDNPIDGPFHRDRSWGFTTQAPVSSEYVGGGPSNNFFTAFIFKTPMTVQYVTAAGAFKYLTMTSQFAEE
jgi:hypothetical protein